MLKLRVREKDVVRIQGEPFFIRSVTIDLVKISFLYEAHTIERGDPFVLGNLYVNLIYSDGEIAMLGFDAPREVVIDRDVIWKKKREQEVIKGY